MKSIWKFHLSLLRDTVVDLPVGAEILDIQMQRDTPCIWALVDVGAPVREVKFEVYGTGWDLPDDPGTYIGTYQEDDTYVWHVFMKEVTNETV